MVWVVSAISGRSTIAGFAFFENVVDSPYVEFGFAAVGNAVQKSNTEFA
jgi:hypothetical protein